MCKCRIKDFLIVNPAFPVYSQQRLHIHWMNPYMLLIWSLPLREFFCNSIFRMAHQTCMTRSGWWAKEPFVKAKEQEVHTVPWSLSLHSSNSDSTVAHFVAYCTTSSHWVPDSSCNTCLDNTSNKLASNETKKRLSMWILTQLEVPQ